MQLDLWSYTDKELQPLQIAKRNKSRDYTAIINIENKKIKSLEGDDEIIVSRSNEFALVRHGLGYEAWWETEYNLAAQPSYYLISLKDGSRKLLKDHIHYSCEQLSMSPEGKWIVYYDLKKKNFFSYETATGITRNVTSAIKTSFLSNENDTPDPVLTWGPGYNTWLKNDSALLIYDNYDIWMIDPYAIKSTVNLTNGYGKKQKIKFTVADVGQVLNDFSSRTKSTLLLTAFNTVTKGKGFCKITIGKAADPEIFSMGPYQYGSLIWEQDDEDGVVSEIIKAKDKESYLVKRMNATEAPNYFITKDFKNFIPITSIQPQKRYNWYNTELHSWKSLDGTTLQGILYKPENFDPRKKYPIIFYYYEKRSDGLNLFLHAKPSEASINIPLFVSNGYLIFSPDIKYKIGNPGQGAFNSVVSAANYLSEYSWVDKGRMGLQGHSWGAYETNYIITNTNIFSAACSAAGVTDMTSSYGSATRGGYSIYHAERGQGRMAGAPWQIPDLYIKNSPIFKADKVTTPLLMMNNKADRQVSFAQGVELFTALRRLGKKVWMLQYDEGGHSVERGKDAEDFHARMMQFFDHYLKDKQAPKWMTRGIPAKMKGIDDGLGLDTEIKTPGPGLLDKSNY